MRRWIGKGELVVDVCVFSLDERGGRGTWDGTRPVRLHAPHPCLGNGDDVNKQHRLLARNSGIKLGPSIFPPL